MKTHIEYPTGNQVVISAGTPCHLCGWESKPGTEDAKWNHRVNGTQCYARRLHTAERKLKELM